MPVRVRIPLPGPFVYVSNPRRHVRKPARPVSPYAVLVGVLVFVVALIVAIVGLADHANASTDPGVAIYGYMHSHGATMPASWAQVVDNDRANICHAYATGYYDRLPVGEVDEFGVTPALAKDALSASGFCS